MQQLKKSASCGGYLEKKGDKGPEFMRTWKRRFFLIAGPKVYYSYTENDENYINFIDLSLVSGVKVTSKAECTFRLESSERVYHLRAPDENELNDWIACLNEAKPGAGAGLGIDLSALGIDPSLLDPSSDNVHVDDDDDDDAGDAHAKLDLTKDVVVPQANIPDNVHDLLNDNHDNLVVDVNDDELNDPNMLAELAAMTGISLNDGTDNTDDDDNDDGEGRAVSNVSQSSSNEPSTQSAPPVTAQPSTAAKPTASNSTTTTPATTAGTFDRQSVEQTIADMRRQCVELKRAGKKQEAIELLREMKQLKATLQQQEQQPTAPSVATTKPSAQPTNNVTSPVQPESDQHTDVRPPSEPPTDHVAPPSYTTNKNPIDHATSNKTDQQSSQNEPASDANDVLASLGLDVNSLFADPVIDDDDYDDDGDDFDGDDVEAEKEETEEEQKAEEKEQHLKKAKPTEQSTNVINEKQEQQQQQEIETKKPPVEAEPTTSSENQASAQKPSTTTTTTTAAATTPPANPTIAAARVEALTRLRQVLDEEIEQLTSEALRLKKAGERAGAIDLLRQRRVYKEADEYAVRALADPSLKLPSWRWTETVQRSIVVNKEIFDNQLEIELIEAKGLRPPSGYSTLDTYIYAELPFPDSDKPQKIQSKPPVPKSIAPKYNCKLYATIERKRSFAKFCERRKVYFQIWHSRFLKDLLVGKVEVKLDELVNRCSSHQTAVVRDAQGRRTRGTLEFVLRLKRPLSGEEVVESRERKLVVDVPDEPALQLGKQVEAVEKKIDNVQEAAAKSPSVGATSSKRTATATNNDSMELTELINPAELVSFEVLSYEMAQLKAMLESNPKNHEAKDLLDELAFKVQMLQTQVQFGALSQEVYIAQLNDRMEKDRERAKEVNRGGNKPLALRYIRRVKIMEKELAS